MTKQKDTDHLNDGDDDNNAVYVDNKSKDNAKDGINVLLIGFILVGWYASNSFHGIAMQLIWANEGAGSSGTRSRTKFLPQLTTAMFITVVQLLLGAVFCMFLLHLAAAEPMHNPLSNCRIHGVWNILALLHALGSLATNLGFLYGKASLVQIIKLFESFETLIFVWLYRQIALRGEGSSNITWGMVASMIVTVGAAAALITSHGGDAHPNAAVFAVISGLTLSARNVWQRGKIEPERSTTRDPKSQLLASLRRFQSMSWQSGILLIIPALLLQCLFPQHNNSNTVGHLIQEHWQVFCWHPLYNVFSICMLGLVSALAHSLLNAIKRIVSILVAIVWYSEPLGWSTTTSLVFVLLGEAWYSLESRKANAGLPRSALKRSLPSNNHQQNYCPRQILPKIIIIPLLTLVIRDMTMLGRGQNGFVLSYLLTERPSTALQSTVSTADMGFDQVAGDNGNLVYDPNYGFRSTTGQHVPRAVVIAKAQQILRDTIGPLIRKDKPVACINLHLSSNVGDSALMEAQLQLLRDVGVPSNMLLVNHTVPPHGLPLPPGLSEGLQNVINEQGGTVLMAAGGNMGEIYSANQKLYNAVIQLVPRARVIHLPQSLVVHDRLGFNATTGNIYRLHPDLHLFLRDRSSYECARALQMTLPSQTYLVPDLAFHLGNLQHMVPDTTAAVKPIGLMWRSDKETVAGAQTSRVELLPDVFGPMDWRGKHCDKDPALRERLNMHLAKQYTKEEFYHHELRRGLAWLSKGDVLITDRLHGQILGFLLGKPLVVARDKTWKGRHFFETWTHVSSDDTKFEETFDGALAQARLLVARTPHK